VAAKHVHLRPVRSLQMMRLDIEWIGIAPPRAAGPIGPAEPNIGIAFHIRKKRVEFSRTLLVWSRSKLAKKALFAVGARPFGEGDETLSAATGDAFAMRAARIGVEVLVHVEGA